MSEKEHRSSNRARRSLAATRALRPPRNAAARAAGLFVLAFAAALAGCGREPVAPAVRTPAAVRPTVGTSSGIVFTQVSAGGQQSCALKADGTVACWGDNDGGQATAPSGTFTDVGAGEEHTCGVRTDGTLACWGHNTNGKATPPAGTFTQVISGQEFSCALKGDGSVVCWGDNGGGQLSPPAGPFTRLTAGGMAACGLRPDGSVACWGGTYPGFNYGQANVPAGLGTVTQVSGGAGHTCAVKTDGTLACWGLDFSGQATPPAGSFTRVGAGGVHSCAIRADGTVTCWGSNEFGQLDAPAGTFVELSAGDYHTCALKSDGTVVCWGWNLLGQSTPPIFTPPTAQAITFTSVPPTTALLGGSYSVSATGGGSGNPVTFSSLTVAVCTVWGSTVSFVAVGTCTVAADQAGNALFSAAPQVTQSFAIVYNFGSTTGGGFAPPVSSTTFNSARAGQSVPVKFNLGGNQGLLVIASGYPQSQAIACPSGPVPVNVVPEVTVTAGGSSLSYDPTTGLYSYVWKTDPAWAGSCRQFVLRLADNTTHTASFQFKP